VKRLGWSARTGLIGLAVGVVAYLLSSSAEISRDIESLVASMVGLIDDDTAT
jgi:hypothetical protein